MKAQAPISHRATGAAEPAGSGDLGEAAERSPSVVGLVRCMRPHQWVKNLFVLVPLVFAKGLLDANTVARAIAAFAAFCAASSAVYVLNDLRDVEADRLHPKKRSRPIASGAVSERAATALMACLFAFALATSLALSVKLAGVIAAYLALNVAYTLYLKRVAYVDVLCIAAGFELRLAAGMVAIGVLASLYLVAVTLTLACFLGFGKRMHELRQGENAAKQRAVLDRYHPSALRVLLGLMGMCTVAVYVLATVDPHNQDYFGTDHLAYTAIFAAVGIARFLHLVTSRPEAESPTDEMLRDRWFLANLGAWAISVVAVIYAGQ